MADLLKKVMISSTSIDLPQHREAVEDAIHRMGMHPVSMDYLTAQDVDAVTADALMIDEADIYVGIIAYRYGFIPLGNGKSATELEYDRAAARNLPILIFFMDQDHPIKPSDVETGDGAIKLKAFKDRVGPERVAGFFKSVDDLRAQTIQALLAYREAPNKPNFHYVSDIPLPPEVYIAHPYTLLQTKDVIGRQPELNLLTDWVAKPSSDVYRARILNVVALGGMGKSAVTWKWFNSIAVEEMKPLTGRVWWSFYESDATFENFVIRALAYVSRVPHEQITIDIPSANDREQKLLSALDAAPYLIVLDGLERILIAYSGTDTVRRMDDEELDKETANRVAGAIGLPESAAVSFVGQHRLRQCIDPRAGAFLRRLAAVRASRVLVSTRLYPSELQTMTGDPVVGSFACFITGLGDDDALNLWRAFGVSGSRDELLRLFHTFVNYPLLIRALAGEVAGYRRAPADFDAWRKAHQDFDPFTLSLVNARTHVLKYSMQNLSKDEYEVLRIVAAFQMPATYEALAAIFVESSSGVSGRSLSIAEADLDRALSRLEDRGLLGWDRRANRYDMHPIVRGVTWSGLEHDDKTNIYERLRAYFEAIPNVDEAELTSIDDLSKAVELFYTLLRLGRYDDALTQFLCRLDRPTLYRLGAIKQRVELLEAMFPDGINSLPRFGTDIEHSYIIYCLAQGYVLRGEPGRAIHLFERAADIVHNAGDNTNLSVDFRSGANAKRVTGALYSAEEFARKAVIHASRMDRDIDKQASILELAFVLETRGESAEAHIALRRAIHLFSQQHNTVLSCIAASHLAQQSFWTGDPTSAAKFADKALRLAQKHHLERDFIRALRLHGSAAGALGAHEMADERLHHALTRARTVNYVEEELPILTALAELRRMQGHIIAARDLLGEAWGLAEHGPFPLLHADALNILCKVARHEGQNDEAISVATAAYRLAWCDGPPYVYHWGLETARALLKELGASEPVNLTPFDPSLYPPMPKVEIVS